MNQGPIWGSFMKKNQRQKSRATVPFSKILCNISESAVLIFDVKKKFSPLMPYDLGPSVSTYLDVSKNVFFIVKNHSPPPPPIGEKNTKKYTNFS